MLFIVAASFRGGGAHILLRFLGEVRVSGPLAANFKDLPPSGLG